MQFFHTLKRTFFSSQQESEFQKSCNALKMLSAEQLNEMHDTLMSEYISKIPSPFLPGLSEEQNEKLRKEYNACIQRDLPNGLVYGCRTYGEAQMLNRLIVKLLDDL